MGKAKKGKEKLIMLVCSREENQVAREQVWKDFSLYTFLYILNIEPYRMFNCSKQLSYIIITEKKNKNRDP